MKNESPRNEGHDSQDALIQALKDRIDDIDRITLFIDRNLVVTAPDGSQMRVTGEPGGQISYGRKGKATAARADRSNERRFMK